MPCDDPAKPESGSQAVAAALATLKRRGCNILIVGTVPEWVRDRMSAQLLGDDTLDRVRLFALCDRNIATVHRRLKLAESDGSDTYVCTYTDDTTAGASSGRSRGADVHHPQPPSPSASTPATVSDTLSDTITDIDRERGGLAPAELRLCLDALDPLVATDAVSDPAANLQAVCEAVVDVGGMGHYILRTPATAPAVRAIQSCFDVTIELAVNDGVPRHRWHLHDTGEKTDWLLFWQ